VAWHHLCGVTCHFKFGFSFFKKEVAMGFVIFFSIIVLLIINEVRKTIMLNISDTEELQQEENDYFDDFETL
jgi:hypothetical protein